MWTVGDAPRVCVRSTNGRSAAWFRGATPTGEGQVVAGTAYDVTFTEAAAAELAWVDAAYRRKYGHYPSIVDHLIEDGPRSATPQAHPPPNPPTAGVRRHPRPGRPGAALGRPGGIVGCVGVPHVTDLPQEAMFWKNVGLRGGPAPARAYLPDLLQRVWDRQTSPAGSSTSPSRSSSSPRVCRDGPAPVDQDAAAPLIAWAPGPGSRRPSLRRPAPAKARSAAPAESAWPPSASAGADHVDRRGVAVGRESPSG
ncbi:MAG: DUF2255 family protein [Oryzihumus sp.]